MDKENNALNEEENKHLVYLLKKMCAIIDVDYDSVDFQDEEWYELHTWTEKQENEYILWVAEELYANTEMREELLEDPAKDITNCFTAAVHFVANFGWDTLGDTLDNLEENK